MGDDKKQISVRLSDEELAALEKEVAKQNRARPGVRFTITDAVRVAIAQSYIPRPRS